MGSCLARQQFVDTGQQSFFVDGLGDEGGRTLALELCVLLLDWPATYPANMREPFDALL